MLKYEILENYFSNLETEQSRIDGRLKQTCYHMRKQIEMAKIYGVQFDERRVMEAAFEGTTCKIVKEDEVLNLV